MAFTKKNDVSVLTFVSSRVSVSFKFNRRHLHSDGCLDSADVKEC